MRQLFSLHLQVTTYRHLPRRKGCVTVPTCSITCFVSGTFLFHKPVGIDKDQRLMVADLLRIMLLVQEWLEAKLARLRQLSRNSGSQLLAICAAGSMLYPPDFTVTVPSSAEFVGVMHLPCIGNATCRRITSIGRQYYFSYASVYLHSTSSLYHITAFFDRA